MDRSNECDITVANRKDCVKCRYEKCLRVGMKKNLVYVVSGERNRSKEITPSITEELRVTLPRAISNVFISCLDGDEKNEFTILMKLVDDLRKNQMPNRDTTASDFIQLREELEFVSASCIRLFRSLTRFDNLPSSLQYDLLCKVIPQCIILRANLFVEESLIDNHTAQINLSSYPFEFKKLTNCISLDCDDDCDQDEKQSLFSRRNGPSKLSHFLLEYLRYFYSIPEPLRKDITVAALVAVNLLYKYLFQSHILPFHLYSRLQQDHCVHVALMKKLLTTLYGDYTFQQVIQTNDHLHRVAESFENVTLNVIPCHFVEFNNHHFKQITSSPLLAGE